MAVTRATIRATLDTTTRTSDSYQSSGPAFDVAVLGAYVANLRLQVSHDAGATWHDLYVFTQPDVFRVVPAGEHLHRLSMAGADFVSGSATIFIGI